MLSQSDDFTGNHTTTEAWPYLYYYCYYYECKSECMMNRLGLSDIIVRGGVSLEEQQSRFMQQTASMIVM